MAQKNIDVRIRAKDDASANAKKIADAFARLATDGKKAQTGAAGIGAAFTSASSGLSKFESELGGIKSLSSLVTKLDKAKESVTRLDAQLASNAKGFESVRTRSLEAASAAEAMRAKVKAEESALKSSTTQLKATNEQLRANKDLATSAARAQDVLNGKQRKGVSGSGNVASSGVGIESGAPVSSARDSFSTFISADIAAAETTKNKLNSVISGLNSSITASKTKLSEYSDELRVAAGIEKEFGDETTRAGNAMLAARADLAQAQIALTSTEDKTLDANAALGTLAFTQEEVAAASEKAEAQLRQQALVLATFQKYASKPLSTGGTIADSTAAEQAAAQAAALLNAREEAALLRTEQDKLSQAIQSGSGNVTQQVDAYDRMSKAVSLAEQEVRKLEIQQRRVSGVTAAGLAGSGGFATWAKEYAPLTQASNAAAIAQTGVAAAADKIAPAATRASAANRALAQSSAQASSGMLSFGENTRTTLSFMQRMRGEVLAITTGFVGFYAAVNRGEQAMASLMSVQNAESRFAVAFADNTKVISGEIAFLNSEADRLGFTFEAIAAGYSKISIAAQSAGLSIQDTRKLFSSLADAARVNGSSMAEMEGVLKSVEQMLSKSKVQAEELRGQLGDRMTAAFKTFADGLGLTTAELDEAMKKGEVYADRDTMLKFAERLEVMYGTRVPKAMQTLAAQIGAFQRTSEKVNLMLAQGFVPAIEKAMATFTAFANSSDGAETFRAIGEAAGTLISIISEIPQYFGLITQAAKVFLAVKFAQTLGSMSTGLGQVSAGFVSFSQSTLAATIQGAKLSAMQRTLMLGTFNVSRAMSAYSANLRASVASTGLARIGTLGLASTISGLRIAMLGIAGVARTMWAAIGGPVGVAVAAIALVYSSWETDADRATAALAEHQRQVEAVKTAYDAAGAGAKDWSNKINGVTLAQAVESTANIKSAYADATKALEVYSRQAIAWYGDIIAAVPDDPRAVQAKSLADMATAFDEGALSVTDFESALNAIALNPADDSLKELALGMLNMLNTSDDAQKSITDLAKDVASSEAKLRVIAGTATDADMALLGLSESVEQTNAAFDDTKSMDAYGAALDELKSKIPSLADELKNLKEMTELNTSAWTAMVAAWKTGDISNMIEVLKLYAKGLGDVGLAQQNAMLDSYGAGNSDVIQRMIYVESGGNADAQNPNSSAGGIGQFIDSTWLSYIAKLYPELTTLTKTQQLALKTGEENRDIQMKVLEAFTRDNQASLLKAGVNAGGAETYLAHFLGSGDAIKVLLANPDELAANIVNADSVAANPSVFKPGMTVGDLINWSAKKMGDGSAVTGTGQTENEKKAETDAASTKKTISDLDHQLAQQALINAHKEREAAIEDAIRSAKAENAAITDEELAAIREKTGALYDQQNAQKGLELSEEKVNQLYSLRQSLLEQVDMAKSAGDNTAVAALKTEIEGVNTELQSTIDKTIAMWAAVGGPEADAAIAKLKTMDMSIKAGKQSAGAFGISMDGWSGIVSTAVQGIVGAFNSFAEAIANGTNAAAAFGSAMLQVLAQVLQQIAAAIIQQTILNMLAGMGGGIGKTATTLGGVATGHTGGVVGSKAIGSGNTVGSGSWVKSAFTYHTGGIAGLKPDEVSATLKKGEEVLTEQDPRHRANGGMAAGSNQGSGERLKQVLAIGDKEIANAMSGSHGEGTTLTHLKRNIPTIKRMLGV